MLKNRSTLIVRVPSSNLSLTQRRLWTLDFNILSVKHCVLPGCLTQNLKKKKVPSPTFSLACLQDYEIHELNESLPPLRYPYFPKTCKVKISIYQLQFISLTWPYTLRNRLYMTRSCPPTSPSLLSDR